MVRSVLAAVVALTIGMGAAKADNQTKTDEFELTRGDFTELNFRVDVTSTVSASATFSSGLIGKDVALRIQLVRKDPTGDVVVKETVGGSPVPVADFLSGTAEVNKNYKIVLRHNVTGQPNEKVKGTLKVTFRIPTETVSNLKAFDLGGDGAKADVAFNILNKPGKLVADVAFADGLFNGKKLTAKLIRVGDNKTLVTKTAGTGIQLVEQVSAADLAFGTAYKVQLTNNEGSVVKQIQVVAKFTPTN